MTRARTGAIEFFSDVCLMCVCSVQKTTKCEKEPCAAEARCVKQRLVSVRFLVKKKLIFFLSIVGGYA